MLFALYIKIFYQSAWTKVLGKKMSNYYIY